MMTDPARGTNAVKPLAFIVAMVGGWDGVLASIDNLELDVQVRARPRMLIGQKLGMQPSWKPKNSLTY